ncbi:MAPK regulated corepressor interacting protein 2 isoform X2 [Sturnira hondurensis]|uniref:MAPK regulated corepressor interacting protein 2 isoform X2 n=1 Tax=Sturnira hondurensis TaxID=192404 RepID=UPI001879DF93|nr:MAPK regulated corepressor interacting protein 2 isoform X2 [Sturnira hondurensis]
MYTITKGPSKLVAQRRTGPTQQQVESRLGELLKCRQPTPPTPPPTRVQPPGPWPLSSAPLGQGGSPSSSGAPEPRMASRRVPGGVARAAQDSWFPPPASRAKACVQSSEWPAAPHHIPIHRGGPGDLHTGPRGERPFRVRSLAASGAAAGWWPSR